MKIRRKKIIMWTIYRVDIILLLSVLLSSVFSSGRVDAQILRTRLGQLEGVKKEARNGKFFFAYFGIPYAEPPIGRLRFEPPVEKKPWNGIFNATEIPPPCPQKTISTTSFEGQEDCLFVHVFTPSNSKPGMNLPVLFFIFGGGFVRAKPTDFGPEFIMGRNIILVMVSYRLGVLGFFSTGDDIIPGNMGLRDQAMAMKWTRENIHDFGGHPRRITIMGHSSGSLCVHTHTMSPLSKDYFDQAIMQSGVTSPKSVWDRDYASTFAQHFGRLVNCPVESTRVLKTCLQSRTTRQLLLAVDKTYVWKKYAPQIFKPVIEDDSVKNAFLNRSHFFGPYPTHSKPWLLGITTGEGALNVGEYFHPDSSVINKDVKLWFPLVSAYHWTAKSNHIDFIVRLVKTRFFGEEAVSNTTDIADKALVKIFTGIDYGSKLIDVVQKYTGSKYVYLMDYRHVGGYTLSKGGRDGRYIGVSHADELPIMFSMNKTGLADVDYAFGEELITRWVNFAYTGNPNLPFPINTSILGAWAAVSSPQIEFLRIKRGGNMETDYFLEEYGMWRKIPLNSKYFAE